MTQIQIPKDFPVQRVTAKKVTHPDGRVDVIVSLPQLSLLPDALRVAKDIKDDSKEK